MLNSIRSQVSPVFCLFLMLAGLGTMIGCESPAPAILGSGVDENADQTVVAAALSNEVIALIPDDNAKIIGAVRPQTGPIGTLFGLGLDDDTRAFVLGTEAADGSVELTGAVLEDAQGNLIMLQENRENGIRITQATGDAVDLERIGNTLRITVTLNVSIPPSTLVIDIDAAGEATLNEAASWISATVNPVYNTDRVTLSRATQSMKLRPRAQTTVSEDCPAVNAASLIIENACLFWGLVTAGVSDDAIDRACAVQQVLLDEIRGSTPIPGLTAETELAPKWIAGAKMGATLGCELVKNGIKLGSAIAHPTIPDIACLVYSLVDDVSRVVTTEARNLPQVICDSITDPEVGIGCSNTCVAANNGRCEDGGPLSVAAICLPATDCNDCWTRDVPGCSNTCATARNDVCEDATTCALGTDCRDCGEPRPVPGCNDTCDSAQDGECDDAGAGSLTGGCDFGTDCTDCGPRDPEDEPEKETEDCFDEGICNLNCPNFDPDVDCTNEELCAGKGLCCEGDGICDMQSCNATDADCTNADVCSRMGFCCDDDNVCNRADAGFECPTTDADCAFCENEDDLCIEDCDPPDPDCASGGDSDDGGCCYDGEFVCSGPMSADECTATGGEPQASCEPNPCLFVCCLPDGICAVDRSVAGCQAEEGTVYGRGTTCADITCEAPSDAFPHVYEGTGTWTVTLDASFFDDGILVGSFPVNVSVTLSENKVVSGRVTGMDRSDNGTDDHPIMGSCFGGTEKAIWTVNLRISDWSGNWREADSSWDMKWRMLPYWTLSGGFSSGSISGTAEWPTPPTDPVALENFRGDEYRNRICTSAWSTMYIRYSMEFTASRVANSE